jgi:hypothetical protein
MTRRQRQGPKRPAANPLRNPVAAALIKRQIIVDLRSLQTDAHIHALFGANDAKLIDHAARLAYISAHAGRACQQSDDSPDMRIIAGMAHALADLANHRGQPELHRMAIQSGLQACQRVLQHCNAWAIGTAALQFDEQVIHPDGIATHHITPTKATA